MPSVPDAFAAAYFAACIVIGGGVICAVLVVLAYQWRRLDYAFPPREGVAQPKETVMPKSSSNILSEIINAVAGVSGTAASTISTAVTGVFASKFATEEEEDLDLQSIGPGQDPNDVQRHTKIKQIETQLVSISTTPQAVYGLLAILDGLVGKTDTSSQQQWSMICDAIDNDLKNVTSSLF